MVMNSQESLEMKIKHYICIKYMFLIVKLLAISTRKENKFI